MKTLTRYNNNSVLTPLRRMLNEPFLGLSNLHDWPFAEDISSYQPKVNIEDLEDKYQLTMEAPGLSKENIQLEFKNNRLTVSSVIENNREEENKNWALKEISTQSFTRSFNFDDGAVEPDNIEATFKDGILTVDLKKTGKQLRKLIEIK